MPSLLRLHGRVLDASGTAVGLAYGGIAVLMTVDIAMRSLGLGSLGWLVELTEYILYGGTFIAAAWTLREGAHVRIDLLPAALRPAAARTLDAACDAFGALVCAVIGWYGAVAVAQAWQAGSVQYKNWSVPEWLLLAPIPFAALLLTVEFTLRALGVVGKAAGAREPAAGA